MHPHPRQNTSITGLSGGYEALFSASYRFSFNGQERTDEIAGTGNHTTALYWEYDTRLGRRWNVDPKIVPWESGYAVNRDNPVWESDPFGDSPKKQRERAQRKFDKKIKEPLFEMERNGKTPDEIEAEAKKLAEKYQNKRWLHFSYKVTNQNNPANNSYTSTAHGMEQQQVIGIKVYNTTTTNAIVNFNRPVDGSMVTTGVATDANGNPLDATAGSTINIQFNPLAVPNSLNVITVDPSGATSNLATTGGMISDQDNTLGLFKFNQTTVVTKTNAGQVQYIVRNSNASVMMDTWQLQIQLTSPPLLNPIPIILSDYPFYK